jgi:hypothetical protein
LGHEGHGTIFSSKFIDERILEKMVEHSAPTTMNTNTESMMRATTLTNFFIIFYFLLINFFKNKTNVVGITINEAINSISGRFFINHGTSEIVCHDLYSFPLNLIQEQSGPPYDSNILGGSPVHPLQSVLSACKLV